MKLDRINYNGGEIWIDREADVNSGDVFELDSKNYPKTGIYLLENPEDASYYYEGKGYTNHVWNLSRNYNSLDAVKANWNKVVAQSITNPSYIDGIPFVEVGEDSVDKVAEDCIKYMTQLNPKGGFREFIRQAVHYGYKAAQGKQFTEADIRNAIDYFYGIIIGGYYDDNGKREVNKLHADVNTYINSLKPKVVSIEIEMTEGGDDFLGCPVVGEERPMTYQKDDKTFLTVTKINYE